MAENYDKAVEELNYPDTWCRGARSLVIIGDSRALVPLIQAYETPIETSKLCLLDAMDALGAKFESHKLYNSNSAEVRRLAIHLMELFPNENHLPILESSLEDEDISVRAQACRSLLLQIQTPTWEALMIKLLDVGDDDIRLMAIKSLSHRHTEKALMFLQASLARERNAKHRAEIKEALKKYERSK